MEEDSAEIEQSQHKIVIIRLSMLLPSFFPASILLHLLRH